MAEKSDADFFVTKDADWPPFLVSKLFSCLRLNLATLIGPIWTPNSIFVEFGNLKLCESWNFSIFFKNENFFLMAEKSDGDFFVTKDANWPPF